MGSGAAILASCCDDQYQRRPAHTRSRDLLGELYATLATFTVQPERQSLLSTDSGCARHMVVSHENGRLRGEVFRLEREPMRQKTEPASLDLRGKV